MKYPVRKIFDSAKVDTLVENRLIFNTDHIELNLFETRETSHNFFLQFADLSLITMLEGKKIMTLTDQEGFDFMPSESLILEKHTAMQIDFPEAGEKTPTRCLALLIPGEEINNILSLLNENVQRYNRQEWAVKAADLKFKNDPALDMSLNKIIRLATSEHPHKKVLSRIATQELVVNLMQTNAKDILLRQTDTYAGHDALAFAVKYIRDHIHDHIDISVVAGKAHMSKATFFRHFKNETGITPHQFVVNEKIKLAKRLLSQTGRSVADVAFTLSFNSVSYFIQIFKKYTGLTPYTFKKRQRA